MVSPGAGRDETGLLSQHSIERYYYVLLCGVHVAICQMHDN